MTIASLPRLFALALVLLCARPVWATDSNIGDTAASSHEIQFCSGLIAPFAGCAAADLRTKADALHSPVAIYEYVRNNYNYVLYHGARSGAINTFAGGRGNDVDLAATLIAMLRSQGVPARYVVGTVRVPSAQVVNWLAAKNLNLASALLRDMGIQNVVVSGDLSTVDFEHVWVEALVPYGDYRGIGNSGIDCVATPASCNWVPLDPSFKQRRTRSSGLDPYSSLSFDYDSYYKAILNSDPAQKDKNPLDIYQNQVLSWLQTNAPGKTLDDIPDYYGLVPEQDGLMPASLPYALVSATRRYNSVQDHDAAVASSTELKNWNKYVTVQAQIGGSTVPGGITASLVDASSEKLTLSWDPVGSGYAGTFRLDGAPTGTAVNAAGLATVNGVSMTLGAAVKLMVVMDGAPALGANSTDTKITATYGGVIGGYYLLATGGETSNWGQVHQAAQKLLAANQQYPIVYNAAETGCDVTTGQNCTPFVDVNGNGYDATDPRLLDYKPALDALTGGLLDVAGRQYFTKSREKLAQLDAINRIRTPIVGFVGLVSSTNSVQYLGGTAFSVEPGGLLIDMKGMTVGGSWRIDQPDQTQAFSNRQFELSGHILSSLEHETWQELTGFDAISTVRGIQIALANAGSLLAPYRNASADTFPQAYPGFGFSASVPVGFTPHTYSLFGQNYQSWSNGNTSAGFEAIYANSQGIPAGDYRLQSYPYAANNGIDGFYTSYASLIQQIQAWQATVGQLKTNVIYSGQNPGYVGQDVVSYSVTSPAGFAVASATRIASDNYQYALNETAQHADGIYTLNLAISLANPSNTTTGTLSYAPSTIQINSALTAGLAGFQVTSYSQPSNTQVTLTIQQTSAHADGTYSVPISSASFLYNGVPYAGQIGTLSVQISAGRVVDQMATLVFNLDTSDNHQLTCQGGAGGANVNYTGTPSQLMTNLQGCFNNMLTVNNLTNLTAFFNQPASLIYRATPLAVDARPAISVASMRDTLYQTDTAVSWKAYRSPSNESTGSNFTFVVDYLKETDTTTGNTKSASYLISNTQFGAAGGGFVTATMPIVPALSFDGTSYGQPTTVSVAPVFDNWNMTNLNLVSQVNNNLISTPSTKDPVSTVTGNNFHDETDVMIKGRGINYAFTRTYNSASSATKQDTVGLGNGWVHSYGMRLVSNDYGKCPNCTSSQAPENGNGKTSSITYTDERGGDHNYVVSESTLAVTPPAGEFDSLVLDTPSSGKATLTFRNGTRYVFQTVGTSDIKTTPNVSARLIQIADPWGNQLNFTYNNANGRLATVADNLGISGRTGLSFSYDASNHLKSITDWSGRSWLYNIVAVGGNPVSYHLASYTNALSKTTSYGYAANSNNLATITKPLRGVATTFAYYQNGRTFNYHDALSNTETLDYDLYRKSTRVADPRGGVREYEYDSAGALDRLVEPDGAELLFSNNPDGLRNAKTDGVGYLTQYSYRLDKSFNTLSDTGGNVTREQDPLNYKVDTTYGPYDQPATVTDKRGTVTTTSFHATTDGLCKLAGKPDTVTISTLSGVANVKLASYCWNADGTPASQTVYLDPANAAHTRITTFYYADASHLNVDHVTSTGWDGTSVTKKYTYDTLGRKTTETLARRNTSTDATLINLTASYSYDNLDRVTQVQDAAGNLAINRYDDNGQLWQVTHQYLKPDGTYDTRNLVTRTFDAADRVSTETDALGGITQYRYDPAGNVIAVTDPEKHTTRFEYDAMNRKTASIDGNGARTVTTYDQRGEVVAVTNAMQESIVYQYDAIGRRTQALDPHGYITRYQYDANGNLTCLIDANAQASLQPKNSDGCTVSTQYDELNRPILVRDALNGVTQSTYDLPGNALTLIDAEGRKYAWTYDGLERMSSETDFTGLATSYLHDEAGNIYQKTNRLNEVTQTTYDVLNRPTAVNYLKDGTSETFGYDPAGNLNVVANNMVRYTLAYDTLNRLLSKLDRGMSLTFTYDRTGNLQTKTTYEGSTTSYTYDSANHLVNASNPDYLSVNYQYDGAGRLLSRVMSSGARSVYGYDTGGFLTSLQHFDATGAAVTNTGYSRDRLGNITALTVSTGPNPGTTTYTLDALYRLTQVAAPTAANSEAFSYDHLGNRLTATRGGTSIGAAGSTTKYYLYFPATQTGTVAGYTPTYNNRLKEIHIGSIAGTIDSGFVFDNEGRLSSQTGTGARTLTWDAKNRVASLTANGFAESYTYDPTNHRIGRRGGALGSLDYYLEGDHLESVYSGSQLQEKYFRGSTIDELVAGYTYQGGKLTPVMFQHDQVMSVVAATQPNGGTQEALGYWAFGETQSTTGTPVSRLKYTGREDDGTGLYQYRARYYDPSLGRFISEDPKGFAAGQNFYAYAGNNPLNGNDPSGLDSLPAAGWGFVIGAATGAGTSYLTQKTQNGWSSDVNWPNVGWSALTSGIAGALLTTRAGQKMGGLASIGASTNVVNYLLTTPMSDWSGTGATAAAASGAAGMLIGGKAPNPYTFLTPSPGLVDRALIGQMVAPPVLGMGAVGGGVGSVDWPKAYDSFVNPVAPSTPAAPSSGSSFNGSFMDMTNSNPAAAAGGFLLYPNQPNTNQMQSVYSKK